MMQAETRTCRSCTRPFVIEPDDFAFYEKIDVPPPTWCPACRLMRRLTWRNERGFHKRTCTLCDLPIISMYPADVPFPVYCRECWYSDTWDAAAYGRDYDEAKPFFAQFRELLNVVPRIALQQDNCVRCDYANQIADCKDCYLVSSCAGSENCAFGFRVNDSKDVLDSYTLIRCEQCYELAMGRYSNRIFFSQGVADSLDLYFCDEPRGAEHCFMSTNLRRRSYVFRNEQLSKDEYERRMRDIDFGSYTCIQALKKEFEELTASALRSPGTFKNVTNTTGNALGNASNCFQCFHGTDLENCRYCLFVDRAKDSVDVNNGCCTMELCYECSTTGVRASDIKFSVDAWPDVRALQYCDSCRSNAHDLFGCISMRGKGYCVLNKQYTKEGYEALLSRVKKQMDEVPYTDAKGRVYRYGEFFPAELSPFLYADSSARDFFSLTKEEILEQGYTWREPDIKDHKVTKKPEDLPDHIKDVPDSILNEVIGCISSPNPQASGCTTAFKIIPEELSFYRRMNLPLPRLCPNCRHYERLKQRNPLKLWHRQCMCDKTTHQHGDTPCTEEFETSYAPERKEIVYCESCYNAEVV